MSSPFMALRHIHFALQREAFLLEEAIAQAGAAELPQLSRRVADFRTVMLTHTAGEDVALYPALHERAPHSGAAYTHDHEDEHRLFDELEGLLADATIGSGPVLLTRLRRQGIALAEHVDPHVRKENGLVLPLVAQLFSASEQGAMFGKIVAVASPEQLAIIFPFIALKLDPEQRAIWGQELVDMLPPPRVAAFAQLIKNGVPAADWADFTRRVPGMAV